MGGDNIYVVQALGEMKKVKIQFENCNSCSDIEKFLPMILAEALILKIKQELEQAEAKPEEMMG